MKALNAQVPAGNDIRAPLTIGYGRNIPSTSRSVPLSTLEWAAAESGVRVARIEVVSPGAAALRVALSLAGPERGLTLRFAGAAADAPVFGPFEAKALALAGSRGALYWSPVLEGDVAIVELRMPADAALEDIVLAIPRVSHQVVSSLHLRQLSAKDAKAIGASGSCNLDIACVVPATQAILEAAKAVARMNFVNDDGRAVSCTGTLLNDSIRSFTPYFFTANHCIDSAETARTLNTYWFYEASACNSLESPPVVQLVNGAALLARSQDDDWSLVRLLDVPPAGAGFAAWRADPLVTNEAVATIHHPRGDLKKWSSGRYQDLTFLSDQLVYGMFNRVLWQVGTTEPGSSGAPLLTFFTTGGYYEVRGGLYAGNASCSAPGASDYFSRIDHALPWVREYLTPNIANPIGVTAAVEFYNRSLNHYFLSTNPVEINNLDSGATRGWVRTGLRFLVYNNPVPGTSPVCRFYRAPAYGDSHFYSASPAECAATAAAHPVDWVYESANVFYVQLPNPTTGVCPARTEPVYRYFNSSAINHRYTTQVIVRDMLDMTAGWIPEGYGPGPYYPAMCAAVE
jgi:hypothetical protein